jgi:hypothetical protein
LLLPRLQYDNHILVFVVVCLCGGRRRRRLAPICEGPYTVIGSVEQEV